MVVVLFDSPDDQIPRDLRGPGGARGRGGGVLVLPDGLLLQQHQPAGQPGQLQPGYCSSVLDHRVTVRYKLFSQLSFVTKLIKTSIYFSSTKLNHMSHAAFITGSEF